jgi:hypothetical protein
MSIVVLSMTLTAIAMSTEFMSDGSGDLFHQGHSQAKKTAADT